MTPRQTQYRVFPRNGWGTCRHCGQVHLTFYVNAQYLVDRELGRHALSDILCKRCTDQRFPIVGPQS